MRPPICLAALSLAAALLAGCGGDSGSSSDADPATVMPRSAVVYVEGVVRPEGDQEEQVRAFLSKVLRTDDPGQEIKALVDRGLREEGGGQTFEKDIEPWLGDRIAVTVTDLAASEPGYIVAAATKDADAAADFLAGEAKEEGAEEGSYEDVAYFTDPEDAAASGVVGDFLVVAATEAEFRKAVDASKGDEALDSQERFTDALDELPDERLGTLYVDPQLFADAAAASADDEAAAGVIRNALKGVRAVTAFAEATSDTATIESRTVLGGEEGDGGLGSLGSGAAPELLQSLPEDAWAAVAVGDIGKSLQTTLEQVAGGLGAAVVGGQLREQTGLDLNSDLLAWMGDTAVFVRGDSPAQIGGGLVVQATDEEAAGRALPKLAAAAGRTLGLRFEDLQMGDADQAYAATVPGAPGPVVLARAGDRVVLAVGDDAAADALDPPGTLGDTDLYERAEEALDDVDPTMIVDAPTAVRLIEQGVAGDPDFAQAKPYLDLLDLLAVGSSKEDDTVRQRFSLKVE